MNELKEELLKNNYTDVLTYLNSGNIILKSNKSEKDISDDVNKDIYDNIIFIMPPTTVEEVIDVGNQVKILLELKFKKCYILIF